MDPVLTARSRSGVGPALIEWARDTSRTFPWRLTNDPYAILVAEKLLQQTAATESVVRVFQTILFKYPVPNDLSMADLDQLKELMRPLGLVYRARELVHLGLVEPRVRLPGPCPGRST